MAGLARLKAGTLEAVRGAALVAALTPAGAAAQVRLPSLDVDASIKAYYGDGHYPSDTYHSLVCTWKSTNADSVSIVGGPEISGSTGTIELGVGSYIFIASGPGGLAVRVVGGFVTARRGTGLDGLIYRFNEQFEPTRFDQESQKTELLLRRPIPEAQHLIVSYLQSMNYTAVPSDSRYFPGGAFVYTSNYAEHEMLRQTARDREQNGEVRRQAALVVMLRPHKESRSTSNQELYVMGVVFRNRPRQDDKWTLDSAGPDLIRPFCRSVLDAIKARLEQ